MADDKSYLPNEQAIVAHFQIGGPSSEAPLPAAPAAPAAPSFEILRTMERDPYEKEVPGTLAEMAAAAAAASDDFNGTDRKVAKISIAPGPVTQFADLGALLAWLPKDNAMKTHHPPLMKDATFDRVAEEKKNVGVKTWLYAASRETDNDYHTILGTDPAAPPRRFINAEVSGLPPAGSAAFPKLRAARTSFESIVQQTPLAGYDFYNPPIPVEVEGSIFYDITHAHGGGTPGPAKTKPKTLWEIHPITSMKTRMP